MRGDKKSFPASEMKSHEAVTLLDDCDFRFPHDWRKLTRNLGIPLSKRDNLLARNQNGDASDTLEECIEHLIRNDGLSWEGLVCAVEKIDKSVAKKLRSKLNSGSKLVGVLVLVCFKLAIMNSASQRNTRWLHVGIDPQVYQVESDL